MNLLKIFFGIIMSKIHQLSPEIKSKLEDIVQEVINNAKDKPRSRVFVMTVGFTHAGKTTLVRKHSKLNLLFHLETDQIHDLLNRTIKFLQDDNTVDGKAYWERQHLTKIIGKRVLEEVFKRSIAVVNTSCNLRRNERTQHLQLAKQFGYRTVIIWIRCNESILLKRLENADQLNVEKGEQPAWVDLYEKVQKDRFEIPEPSEADELIVFESEGNDPKELDIEKLDL